MSDKKIIVISALMVVFIIASTYIQTRKSEEENNNAERERFEISTSEIPVPSSVGEILEGDYMQEITEMEEQLSENDETVEKTPKDPEKTAYEIFSINDTNIKLKYPSHFEVLSDIGDMEPDYEDIQIIFAALSKDIEDTGIALAVLKGIDFKKEDFIEKTGQFFEEEEQYREILEEKKTKDGYILNTKYESEMGKLKGKEKLIIFNNDIYLVSLFIKENLWEDFQKQINYIIDSVSLNH